MKRETLQSILRFLFKVFTRLEWQGLEYIPAQGGIIVTTNHMSRLDVALLLLTPTRPDITALVADKYKSHLLFNFMVETAQAIWIDRSKADFSAFAEAVKMIRNGTAMGIAPEGTRSDINMLLEGKPGTILLAQRAGVPIVPVGISGTDTAVRQLLKLQRPHIVARFGPPYNLPPIDRNNKDESLKLLTDEVMCRIAVLLPERYHGFYKGHPRVKELQSGLGI